MKKLVIASCMAMLFSSQAFAALKIDSKAPSFSLRSRANGVFSVPEKSGAAGKKRGVIVSFFASWCIQCRKELPILNSLVDELNSQGVTVVIVGVKENFERIDALLSELKVDKPVVLSDADGGVAEKYQILFLPTTYFIGSDGKVKDRIFGEISDKDELRKSAAKLLK